MSPYLSLRYMLIYIETVVDPKHNTDNELLEGFTIGGMTPLKLKTKYSRSRDLEHVSPYQSALSEVKLKGGSATMSEKELKFEQTRSFVLNEDMRKLRQAELVILKEETKFGSFKRDPYGRITSSLHVS